ncbi:MAG: flagellar M-ring protein FliF [Alphaproteobacteria bacterium]|nr:flagellar M-ring protein FliF [Alphaproteobacteria bacterium]
MADTTTMDNMNSTAVVEKGNGVLSNVRRLTSDPSVQKSLPTIIALVAAVLSVIIYLALQQPSLTPLYASLPEAEKARVVDALKNAGYDVSVDPSTGNVLVPTNNYHQSRMALAAQGLPASVPDGYSAVSDIPIGSSRSVENIRLKQSQEIELARSVGEIQGVIAARVHLAIPEKSVFARTSIAPTASVFVQLNEGRSLSRQQVNAIIHLVSSSVPSLSKSDVTVVDQYGGLLSNPNDDPASALSDAQLEHRIKIEAIYRSRIISLVSPLVGAGNVTAQVNLDIDFTKSEVTEESVDPEGNALRSEQNSLDLSAQETAKGVPGATTNRAPTQAEITNQQNDGNDPEEFKTRSSNEVRNYEVSRKVETTLRPSNKINRIQASVLVRERENINPETGLLEAVALTPAQIANIEQLVTNAIGINQERGDQLTVNSAAFVSNIGGISKAWYEIDFFINLVQQFMTFLIMGIIVLGVIRPLINRILIPSAHGKPGEAMIGLDDDVDLETVEIQEGESLEDIKAKLKPKKASISPEMLDTANSYDDKVAIIRMIVGEESGRVANVFKSMMKAEN